MSCRRHNSPGGLINEWLGLIVGEVIGEELLILGYAGPCVLCGRAQDLEDQVKLILHGGPREQRPTTCHLVEYAAHTPATGNTYCKQV